ncbi:MAG: hypothetical protein VR64_16265 [Desulfatitalea sp. BRH_c12]|nr:MAG: hypothetical protein VR64_16265 [Desulfatitalea sp. BRH_c12]
MGNAASYCENGTLKNGIGVRIRSIRPDDKHRLFEAFRNLETESVYTRFFHHKKTLTDEELTAATEVDFESVVALVVTVGEGESETIIGSGRFMTYEDKGALMAEVAFTVEEDYHGQGVAGLLLRHLVSIARTAGVTQLEAEVLSTNKAMLRVFSRSGLPMEMKNEGGVVRVGLMLKDHRNV